MKQNLGVLDRVIRALVAVLIGYLFYANIVTGVWAYVLLILACILFATALVGVCPIYMLLHKSTNAKNHVLDNK